MPKSVQARFDHGALLRGAVYTGTMHRVRCSLVGALLAHACRLIGTPLVPYQERNIPMSIALYTAKKGVIWERIYKFPGRKKLTVRSTKVITDDGSMLEYAGAGLAVRFRVYESDGRLYFQSTEYLLNLAGLMVKLPDWLTPGAILVTHSDEGGGDFRFTMGVEHSFFGETYFQDGIFREKEGGAHG